MLRKSTIEKFEQYYKGNSNNQFPVDLVAFIGRNWKSFKEWSYTRHYSEKHLKCPACGKNTLDEVNVRNALSRYCKKYICSDCGVREAFEGYFWKV